MSPNPARPASGAALCRLEEITEPGAKGFDFREGEVRFAGFVVRRNGGVFGYVDSCPHAGWPLAIDTDRYLVQGGSLILCSGHGALFGPEDGICLAGPCVGWALEPWPVTVDAEGILRTA